MSHITARKITKGYGGKILFSDLDFRWDRPGIYKVEGASGTGKTTLLRIVAGLEKADSGDVLTEGKIACIFQEPRLFPEATLLENAACVTSKKSAKPELYLKRLGLDGALKTKAANASGGMKQRTSIARAFAAEADIILADEPFASQDEDNVVRILSLFEEFAESGGIIVLVSHINRGTYNGIINLDCMKL